MADPAAAGGDDDRLVGRPRRGARRSSRAGRSPGSRPTTSASVRCPGPSETPSAIDRRGGAVHRARPGRRRGGRGLGLHPVPRHRRGAVVLGRRESGYAPVRADATEIDPLAPTYADDPAVPRRLRPGQLRRPTTSPPSARCSARCARCARRPPQMMADDLRRRATSRTSLTAAADQANLLIIDYNTRN